MKRIVFRPAARTDVLYVYRWYERQRAGLGIQSREQLDAALERIRGRPQAFPVAYRGLRRARLHRFPYLVFFREVDPDLLAVIAVFHARNDPAILSDR